MLRSFCNAFLEVLAFPLFFTKDPVFLLSEFEK